MTASRAVYPLFLLSLGGILRKWGADESREIKEGRRRVVARLRGGEDMIDITKGSQLSLSKTLTSLLPNALVR
eukprot:1392482-Amorphochlora_amoeboformis.AAC.2